MLFQSEFVWRFADNFNALDHQVGLNQKKILIQRLFLLILLSVLLNFSNAGKMVWVSGPKNPYQMGNYGTKGEPNENNIPGARTYSVSWTDSSNNFYLFGGMISADGTVAKLFLTPCRTTK